MLAYRCASLEPSACAFAILCKSTPAPKTHLQNGFRATVRHERRSRCVGRLGTDTSSNCRSEGLRAAVRSLVSNKLSSGHWLSLVSAQKTSARRG